MDTKTCSKCGEEKPLDGFPKNKTKKDGYSHHCKICQRENVRSHYKNNPEYYKKKARKRGSEILEWYHEFKDGLKCEQCGEDHKACIEFHHVDPNQKDMELNRAVNNGWCVDRLKKEIAKCKVLCSNCHRKLHYEERTGPWKNHGLRV